MFRCSDADLLVSRSDACIWGHTNMFSRIDGNEQPNEQVRDSLDDVIQPCQYNCLVSHQL